VLAYRLKSGFLDGSHAEKGTTPVLCLYLWFVDTMS